MIVKRASSRSRRDDVRTTCRELTLVAQNEDEAELLTGMYRLFAGFIRNGERVMTDDGWTGEVFLPSVPYPTARVLSRWPDDGRKRRSPHRNVEYALHRLWPLQGREEKR